MEKPKGKVFFVKKKNHPPCYGDNDVFKTCEAKSICEFVSQCKKICDDVNVAKERETEIRKDNVDHRITLAKRTLSKYLQIKTWVDLIQSFESLLTVVFIDALAMIVLISAVLSVYFLWVREWKYVLCSMSVCITLAFILDRMDRTKISEGGNV